MTERPLLEVRDLVKTFTSDDVSFHRRRPVHAVDKVSFDIGVGEIVGLVGESGSGKSTVARCLVRLTEPTSGQIILDGTDTSNLSRRQLRPYRRKIQIVYQDPYSALDPRMTTERIIAEPLQLLTDLSSKEVSARVGEMLELVGLRQAYRRRFPHELSGGQRQRVGIARALSVRPSLLIADEPTSALDVSVQASVINLILRLQREFQFSCLFISHDLSLVEFVSQRVLVMYLGKLVETGPRNELFQDPLHPYTQALLSASLVPDPEVQSSRERTVLPGDVPSATDVPSGCSFHPRCPVAFDRCSVEVPDLRPSQLRGTQEASCHLVPSPHVAEARIV